MHFLEAEPLSIECKRLGRNGEDGEANQNQPLVHGMPNDNFPLLIYGMLFILKNAGEGSRKTVSASSKSIP